VNKTQRFERIIDGGREVWEIWLRAREITIRTVAPKPKARPKQTLTVLASKVVALAEYEPLVAEKSAAGWTPKIDERGSPLVREVRRHPDLEAATLAAP